MKTSRTGKNARTEYEASLTKVQSLIADIASGINQYDRKNARFTNEPHWGHVGDLDHYAARLADIADQLHRRGEYDPSNCSR